MARKQIKLAVPEEFYKQLQQLADEHNLPISTFARTVLAKEMGINEEATKSTKTITVKPDAIEDKLVYLEDILRTDSNIAEALENPAKTFNKSRPQVSTDAIEIPNNKGTSQVSINIVINNFDDQD